MPPKLGAGYEYGNVFMEINGEYVPCDISSELSVEDYDLSFIDTEALSQNLLCDTGFSGTIDLPFRVVKKWLKYFQRERNKARRAVRRTKRRKEQERRKRLKAGILRC